MSTAEEPSNVSRVAIRVPPFWPADPALWFGQLEGQFLINGVTRDDTKYGYVIGNLDAKYAAEVKDIITAPPDTGKYDKIKRELIARLSATQEQKTRQLLEREELGDRKPSQFLRRLRDLGGDTITESLLRTLWIGRLPNHLQAILATQSDANLEAVATLADKVMEVSPQAQVAAADTSHATGQISELVRRLDELQRQVSRLQRPTRRRSPAAPRSRQPSREGARERKCWYHYKFGKDAKKCTAPCSFSSGNDAGDH